MTGGCTRRNPRHGALPDAEMPAEMPDAIRWLGKLHVPAVLTLWMATLVAITFYRLDRGDHEANPAALAARR